MPPVVEFAAQPANPILIISFLQNFSQKIGSLSKQDIYPYFDFIDIIH